MDLNEGESDRKAGRKFFHKNLNKYVLFFLNQFPITTYYCYKEMKRDNSELTTKDVNVNVPPECKIQ